MTTAVATFFDSFAVRKWCPPPFFYGFAAKKVTAAMLSPSSMVAILVFSLCCCLCFSSLKLTIGNNWWFLV
jgi:hypothetical protein